MNNDIIKQLIAAGILDDPLLSLPAYAQVQLEYILEVTKPAPDEAELQRLRDHMDAMRDDMKKKGVVR